VVFHGVHLFDVSRESGSEGFMDGEPVGQVLLCQFPLDDVMP
jgi:hypothetical protein